MTRFYVGTAGWSYLKWDKEFYPKGTKTSEKLAYYAQHFNAVELNNSFYRTPTPEQYTEWEAHAPANFRFAMKASRYITHVKRLKEPLETVPHFLNHIDLKKPSPVFFQLPPVMPLDIDRLQAFLVTLPKVFTYAIELRDPRWHCDAVYDLLKQHNVAFCLYDTPEGTSPRTITSDFGYVRLRGRDDAKLKSFLQEWRDWLSAHYRICYVFFDNREEKRLAFGNALLFRDLVGQ